VSAPIDPATDIFELPFRIHYSDHQFKIYQRSASIWAIDEKRYVGLKKGSRELSIKVIGRELV